MSTNNSKISVICCNFNHEKYIKQSIVSLLKQTYSNIEIIIVDDCSTDNSKEIILDIKKLDNRIIEPLFLNKNMGKWFALNKGIERSTGNIIAISDADDVNCNQRLELQLQTLKKMNSFHNLCGFHNCNNQKEIDIAKQYKVDPSIINEPSNIMSHNEVVQWVYKGRQIPGINHYFTGNFETHGASSIFYRQLWEHGMKFLPGNIGLRVQKAEDSDHNTKLTLLLQRTSILKLPLYAYRRGTTTNGAFLELK